MREFKGEGILSGHAIGFGWALLDPLFTAQTCKLLGDDLSPGLARLVPSAHPDRWECCPAMNREQSWLWSSVGRGAGLNLQHEFISLLRSVTIQSTDPVSVASVCRAENVGGLACRLVDNLIKLRMHIWPSSWADRVGGLL